MKRFFLALGMILSSAVATAADLSHGADNFYTSDKVTRQKVTFKNQYQMNVVGNLFVPRGQRQNDRRPAIVVGHPMGAVKEQSSNLYAQKLAEQGFVTLAIDLSFWGESDGKPGHLISPEIYSDDFSAAVDYLSTRTFVDPDKIGVLGICGSGSFVISAAKIDPRMKAIATVSMYDMGSVFRQGLKHAQTAAQRQAVIASATEQRFAEFTGGETVYIPGTVNKLDETTPAIQREFFDFYRTARGGVTPEGQQEALTTKPMLSSVGKFMNFYPFNDIETISPRPMLFITGDRAHSKEFSEDAWQRAGQPKELYIVPGAGHVDLYDRTDLIPFAKLTTFFNDHLK
ncbi:alpha/beta hydrolase [Erwinia persicina]|uniref:alpha/beta hydrolase n=1 Tax=Erwinia persicina TaxID=55211 RepID=UPI001782A582|nr:alpha/beta hydrolase [Erwinia persicina]MBD8164568.1 alpha/beta hydrolase [Erwinia persicina]